MDNEFAIIESLTDKFHAGTSFDEAVDIVAEAFGLDRAAIIAEYRACFPNGL